MKVAVTGASGLIGRSVCQLLAREHETLSVGRTDPRLENVAHLSVDLERGEIPLPSVDAVIHLAQSHRYRDLPSTIENVVGVNVFGTARLIEASRRSGATTFVFASSGSVYSPGTATQPMTLADVGDISLYGATKRGAELIVSGYREYLATVSLRYFMVYGPGQDERMMFPSLLRRVQNQQPLSLEGDAGLHFNPTYVSDAAAATVAALAAGSGAYDVCGPETVSIRDVGVRLGEITGRQPVFESRPGPEPYLVGTCIPQVLGTPEVNPSEGMRRWVTEGGLVTVDGHK